MYGAPPFMRLGWEPPVELSVRPYLASAFSTLIRDPSILSMMDVRRHLTAAQAYRVALMAVWPADMSEFQLRWRVSSPDLHVLAKP